MLSSESVDLALVLSCQEQLVMLQLHLLLSFMHVPQVFISNAGVSYEELPWDMTVVTPKILIDTYTTNTMGPFLATQELLKHVSPAV